jgi:peptidoglycan hydrolase CwlO-like protein
MKRTEIIKTNCIEFDNVALNGLMVQKLLLALQRPQVIIDTVQDSIHNMNTCLQNTVIALNALTTDLSAIQQAVETANGQITELQTRVAAMSEFLIILEANSTVFENAS